MPVITKSEAELLKKLTDIHWATWMPLEEATLCFVTKDDELLLIRKKRGLGAGKVNAPGGRLEKGESFMEAAIRETQEEVGLVVSNLQYAGEHYFQFKSGYSMYVQVFVSDCFTGALEETEEALPFWVKCSEIPYSEMWEDDIYWVPHMLNGIQFSGRYLFDGDEMLSWDVQLSPSN
jgi:8-oxo-dGTP diphosphatase